MIFTRYLYLHDEVKIALMASLLNKSNASIFWAYELYYSGFENELVENGAAGDIDDFCWEEVVEGFRGDVDLVERGGCGWTSAADIWTRFSMSVSYSLPQYPLIITTQGSKG